MRSPFLFSHYSWRRDFQRKRYIEHIYEEIDETDDDDSEDESSDSDNLPEKCHPPDKGRSRDNDDFLHSDMDEGEESSDSESGDSDNARVLSASPDSMLEDRGESDVSTSSLSDSLSKLSLIRSLSKETATNIRRGGGGLESEYGGRLSRFRFRKVHYSLKISQNCFGS